MRLIFPLLSIRLMSRQSLLRFNCFKMQLARRDRAFALFDANLATMDR